MNDPNDPQALSLRETARGVAVRAGILSMAALVIGTWLFSLAARAASGVVKIVAAILLLLIGGGFAAWQVKQVQRRLSDGNRERPALEA